jgi:hypothetical protein
LAAQLLPHVVLETDLVANHTTHLVCRSVLCAVNTLKYTRALQWGVKVRAVCWVCMRDSWHHAFVWMASFVAAFVMPITMMRRWCHGSGWWTLLRRGACCQQALRTKQIHAPLSLARLSRAVVAQLQHQPTSPTHSMLLETDQ